MPAPDVCPFCSRTLPDTLLLRQLHPPLPPHNSPPFALHCGHCSQPLSFDLASLLNGIRLRAPALVERKVSPQPEAPPEKPQKKTGPIRPIKKPGKAGFKSS